MVAYLGTQTKFRDLGTSREPTEGDRAIEATRVTTEREHGGSGVGGADQGEDGARTGANSQDVNGSNGSPPDPSAENGVSGRRSPAESLRGYGERGRDVGT